MSKKYVYIDEFGAFGFDFTKPNVSTHFIIGAVIVDSADHDRVIREVEEVKNNYFKGPEMKSNKIAKDHNKRKKLIQDLLNVDFKILLFIADKREMWENTGLRRKQSFYKFLNNRVHKELKLSFSDVTIFADETGSNDYMQSFISYFNERKGVSDLFGESKFGFQKSTNSILIQLADIICGSVAYNYDIEKMNSAEGNDYKAMLSSKIVGITLFPDTYKTFSLNNSVVATEYDKDIAEVCYRRAASFLSQNEDSKDDDIKKQVITLKYLLFRFMNNDKRHYISTRELRAQLEGYGYNVSEHVFRNKIIASLRDKDVIIASCSLGYKIPSKEKEICDFVNHYESIILPMVSRLQKCCTSISLGTSGKVNILDKEQYKSLKNLLD